MLFTAQKLDTEQLSLFLGSNFVVTFQDPANVYDPRASPNTPRIRCTGPDYSAYAILDAVVDNYFPALERYGEQLEELEQEVVTRPGRQTLGKIHDLKRDLLTLRRAVWPAREALNSLVRDESPYITRDTRTYLRDCYDHAVRVMDVIETDRETAFGLLETYLSSMSNRMNEIMKVLTIIATIFIPLTFMVDIPGINSLHARAALALGLSRRHVIHGCSRRRHAVLLPPQRLAMGLLAAAPIRPAGKQSPPCPFLPH